jgi:hypothetical protein
MVKYGYPARGKKHKCEKGKKCGEILKKREEKVRGKR